MVTQRTDSTDASLSVGSVCRALPTPTDPTGGMFVFRRLHAVAKFSGLNVLQPIPYFPLLRPLPEWAASPAHEVGPLKVRHCPMFYLPKIKKQWDGHWLARSVRRPLADLQRKGQLDIIDAHFAYPDGAGCVSVGRELNVPVVITLRGVEEDYMRVPSIAAAMSEALKEAQGCIAVSHTLRDTAVAAGANPDSIEVIHNAVDRGIFRPASRSAARRLLDIPDDVPLIVSVGNLLSVKRHTVLIEAFSDVLQMNSKARLVIVGGKMHEPDYPEELRNLCRRLNLLERVTFTGKLPESDVVNWLNAASVFALASRREGCCNAILEALACGLPVVATPVGDNPHFVRDNVNGFLVTVDDRADMARGIMAVLDRPDWDRDRISAGLQIGDWNSVAAKVTGFMRGRVEHFHSSGASSG